MSKDGLLTTEELAARWGFNKQTLINWRRTEVGPMYIKFGKAVRYRLKDIQEYEKEYLVETREQA